MKNQNIIIEKVHYYGDNRSRDFNAKVLYWKYKKLRLAHIYIDFFNERVYIPPQPPECTILAGFEKAINDNQFKKAD